MTRSFGTPTNRPSSLFLSPSNAKNDAGNNKLLPTLHEIGLGRTDGRTDRGKIITFNFNVDVIHTKFSAQYIYIVHIFCQNYQLN